MSDRIMDMPRFGEFTKWILNDNNRESSLTSMAAHTADPLWWLYLTPQDQSNHKRLQAVITMADYATMLAIAGGAYTDALIRSKLTNIYNLTQTDYKELTIKLVAKITDVVAEDDRQVTHYVNTGRTMRFDGSVPARRVAEAKLAGVELSDRLAEAGLAGAVNDKLLETIQNVQ